MSRRSAAARRASSAAKSFCASRSSRAGDGARAPRARGASSSRRASAAPRSARRPSRGGASRVRRRGAGRRSPRSAPSSGRRAPGRRARRRDRAMPSKTAANTASKAGTWSRAETNTARAGPVQRVARRPAAPAAAARAKRDRPLRRRREPGVVQRAPRTRAASSGHRRSGAGSVSHRRPPAREAALADELLVLAVLQHRAERALGRRRVEPVDARAARSAATQSIASAIPGGFCRSAARSRRDARRPRRPRARRGVPGTRRRTISASRSGAG